MLNSHNESSVNKIGRYQYITYNVLAFIVQHFPEPNFASIKII